MILDAVLVFLCGAVVGIFVAAYTARVLKQEHKIFSARTVWIGLLSSCLWLMLLYSCGFNWLFLLYALAVSALLALSVVDLAIYEIPIECNIFILAIGVVRLIMDLTNWQEYIIGMVCVSGFFFLLALITKGKGMGGGDIKLMATVGLLLGWQKILLVMVLGSLLGSVIHLVLMKVTGKERMLAFGPYLAAASFIAICYGQQLIDLYIRYVIPE